MHSLEDLLSSLESIFFNNHNKQINKSRDVSSLNVAIDDVRCLKTKQNINQ